MRLLAAGPPARYLLAMSAIELRGLDRTLLAESDDFQIDVIDLLGEGESLLYTWSNDAWKRPQSDDVRFYLRLEATDPATHLTIGFRDLTASIPEVNHNWAGAGPLFFRAETGSQLELVAAYSIDQPGELLARLELERGLWQVPGADPRRFDKLFFGTKSPQQPRGPEHRRRLSLLAKR